MKRTNAIAWLGAWFDACSLWRLYMPHFSYPGSSFFIFGHSPKWELIAGNDVVVVQRCCTRPQYEFIQRARDFGMKVVYDLDDQMWDVPKFNPAYESLQRFKEGFGLCIREVDAVAVSTLPLQRAVRNNVKNLKNKVTGKEIPVLIAENRVETRLFSTPRKNTEEVLVGWAGSSSHVGDLEIAKEGLLAAAKEHPEVIFEFRGLEPPVDLRSLPNVRFKLWMPVSEFCARMPQWGWSIALAPLVDLDFNAAKSCIKVLEAAYCKIPCLMSWTNTYAHFCSHDKELEWLLCASSSAWGPKLRELINDPARRDYLGERMYRVMLEHYSYNRPHEGWQKVFEAVR